MRRWIALAAMTVGAGGPLLGVEPPDASEAASTLYILSVGVDASVDPREHYDSFTHDALQARQALASAGQIYREVRSRTLTRSRATPPAVLAAFRWLEAEMTDSDVAVISFRAHGDIDRERGFHLSLAAPPATTEKGVSDSNLLWGSMIHDGLRAIRGRQIVLVGACRAGGLIAGVNNLPERAAFLLSCGPDEFSAGQLERTDVPSGYFTIAWCEALAGLADKDVDGVVTLSEAAAYVPSRAAAFYQGQNALVHCPANFGTIALSRPPMLQTVQQLWTPRVWRNPFGMPDVYDADGADVRAFAARVKLTGAIDDANAVLWPAKPAAGSRDSLEGEWASRWNSDKTPEAWNTGRATVRVSGDRVYILYQDNGLYVLDLRRTGSELVGRYLNMIHPSDSLPWAGRILDGGRIDGQWPGGRWDFRRMSSETTGPATDQ